MSVQAMAWALDFPAVNGNEKAVLFVLANYANEYGASWPSQATLARQARCTDRTIRTILASLQERGVIRRIRRRRPNGSRQSDIVILLGVEGRKPPPPGWEADPAGAVENPVENPPNQPEMISACAANRKPFPGAPETVSALDTSVTHQDYNLARACEMAGGQAIDSRACWANPRSAIEMARWIEAGADIAKDIIPTIKARAAKARPGSIRSWAYFTEAIMEAMARRKGPGLEPSRGARRAWPS